MEWNEVRHVKVDANSDGQRIDNFLMKHLPGVPKSAVYRLVRSGQVRVDGGRAKPERKLVAAESVRIPPVRLQDPAEAIRPPDRVLNELRESVIYEDAHYLVINKPEGLSSHGGTGQLYGVIEAIRAWEKYEFIELCHRLDRDTSGVLLLAKGRPALLRAQRAFKNHELTKRYFALVHGRWKGEDKDCDAALVKVRLGDQHHVQLDEEGALQWLAAIAADAASAAHAEPAVAFVVALAVGDRVHVVPEAKGLQITAAGEPGAQARIGVLGDRFDVAVVRHFQRAELEGAVGAPRNPVVAAAADIALDQPAFVRCPCVRLQGHVQVTRIRVRGRGGIAEPEHRQQA